MAEIKEERIPHNYDAEQAVLGRLLQDNSIIDEVFATINSDMFYSPINRAIFSSIGELRNEGTTSDKITVKDQAIKMTRSMQDKVNWIKNNVKQNEGISESSLSDEYFEGLLNIDPYFSGNIIDYCHIIKEKYVLREAIKIANRVIVACQNGEDESETICNMAQDDFFRLSSSNDDKSYVRADELLGKIFEGIEDASKSADGITGVKTSFAQLDAMTAGLQKTDMIVLAGRPGQGKTTFSLNLAYNIAGKNDYSVAFFSLEMTDQQLVKKVISDLSHVPMDNIRSGNVSDAAMKDLIEASRLIYKKKLYILDNSYLTIAELRNQCMKIQKKHGLDIVFIDYLQLMHAGSNYRNSNNTKNGFASRQEEIAEISRNIKGLAKELNVPIIALSQVNRDVENRKTAVPQLSDIRESGAIEQDADIIMFISRGNKDEDDGSVDLTIAKHRNGRQGTINLRFDKATSSFEEWDRTSNANS